RATCVACGDGVGGGVAAAARGTCPVGGVQPGRQAGGDGIGRPDGASLGGADRGGRGNSASTRRPGVVGWLQSGRDTGGDGVGRQDGAGVGGADRGGRGGPRGA